MAGSRAGRGSASVIGKGFSPPADEMRWRWRDAQGETGAIAFGVEDGRRSARPREPVGRRTITDVVVASPTGARSPRRRGSVIRPCRRVPWRPTPAPTGVARAPVPQAPVDRAERPYELIGKLASGPVYLGVGLGGVRKEALGGPSWNPLSPPPHAPVFMCTCHRLLIRVWSLDFGKKQTVGTTAVAVSPPADGSVLRRNQMDVARPFRLALGHCLILVATSRLGTSRGGETFPVGAGTGSDGCDGSVNPSPYTLRKPYRKQTDGTHRNTQESRPYPALGG